MANEVTFSTLNTNGGRVSELLSAMLHTNLYDPIGLRVLMDFVPWDMVGSSNMKVPGVTRGAAMAAASSETSGGFSNTALTTTEASLTVALYGLLMQPTDLMQITGGTLDVDVIISILVESLDLTLTDLLTALFSSLSNSVGTSGVDLSVDDIYDAMYQLNNSRVPIGAGQPVSCVLAPVQWNDLQESLRSETGAVQFRQDSAEALRFKGPGFKGLWNGIAFYDSDSVPTTSGNRDGAMFGAGTFKYTLAPWRQRLGNAMMDPADVVVSTDEMWVERSRDHANSMTALYAKAYPAVAEMEDARGVKIQTDA